MFNTSSKVPATSGQQIDSWPEHLSQALHTEWRIEAHGDASPAIELVAESPGPLVLLRLRGDALRLRRTSDPGASMVLVHYQLEGNGVLRGETGDLRLEPGDLCFCSMHEVSELAFEGAFQGVWAVVPERELAPTTPPEWRRHAGAAYSARSGGLAVLADHLRSVAGNMDVLRLPIGKEISAFTARLVAAALQTLDGKNAAPPTRIDVYHRERIRRFVRGHLCNPALDVPFIAQGVGLSVRYVHRLFENEALRLMQWVWKERLEHCYKELKSSYGHARPRPISEVAYAWGFNDQAHFSRAFRKYFGLTPRDVRNGKAASATPPIGSE